ncbi:MAG: hypothetical protein K2Q03_03535 [Sphingobacteriaceae bacterium]|nr:hypothetical protein [Sphingobacteriaceae bacterium]
MANYNPIDLESTGISNVFGLDKFNYLTARQFSVNFNDLFNMVWGYKPNYGHTQQAEVEFKDVQVQPTKKKTSEITCSPLYGVDKYLGKEIYLPIVLENVMLQLACMSVSAKKNIVETVIVGRQGTVKELISAQDYQINIKGFFVDQNGEYPEAQVMELKRLYDKNTSLKIKSLLTDILGDSDMYVVLESFSLPEMRGIRGVQAYEVNCISDKLFELEIK